MIFLWATFNDIITLETYLLLRQKMQLNQA